MARSQSQCQTLQGHQANLCLAACCSNFQALCHMSSSHLVPFSQQGLPAIDVLHHAAGPT